MTSITTTNRDIKTLKPIAQTAITLLFQECYKAGITDIFVTETFRSKERQKYLYSQGRTRPGNVVTWTLESNHMGGLAWDIAVSPPKGLYDSITLGRVGAIAKKLGIEWGGYWKAPNYDAPHFQVDANWKMPKGYVLEGEVSIPTKSSERITVNFKNKKGDDDILKFTNETTRKVVRDHIQQMISNGYVDNSWLSKFDNETMTNGDYDALKLISNQKKANKK
ncbi:endolysin-like protein [Lysinibacillus phage vB_LspM-01]|nr:endolysin-like protein [Lysinibacillus phage vB_LspM-01]